MKHGKTTVGGRAIAMDGMGRQQVHCGTNCVSGKRWHMNGSTKAPRAILGTICNSHSKYREPVMATYWGL